MAQTAQSRGWWFASDGRWYPPELHPNTARPNTVTSTEVNPTMVAYPELRHSELGRGAVSHLIDRISRPSSRTVAPAAEAGRARHRGALLAVALGAVAVLAGVLLPFYRMTLEVPGTPSHTASLLSPAYGGWRVVVPVLALVTIVGAVALLARNASRGSGLKVALRVSTLAMGVAALMAARAHTPSHCSGTCLGAASSIAAGGWVALVGSLLAAGAVLAAGRRR